MRRNKQRWDQHRRAFAFVVMAMMIALGPLAAPASAMARPLRPTNVAAETNAGVSTVTWTNRATNNRPVDSWNVVLFGETGEARGNTIEFSVTEPFAVVEDLAAGRWEARINAVNEFGVSNRGEVDFIVVSPPSRPTDVNARLDGDDIVISWSPPSDDGGSSITGYRVVLDGETFLFNQNRRNARLSDAAPGRYSFAVAARNDGGWSEAVRTSIEIEAPTVVPGPPRSVVATTSGQRVTVTWQAPSDPGTSPITGYEVTVAGITQSVSGTRAVFNGVDRGGQSAIVRAVSDVGRGPIASSNDVSVLRPFDPFNSVDSFVAQQYRDFLGRSPDSNGLAFWSSAVGARGENVADVVEQFVRSSEFEHRRSVIRLYLAYFNRFPESGGFDYWSERLANGTATLDSISQFFATSDEFVASYGALDDGQFVVLVYNNVLVRQPEQGGFIYWTDRMSAGLNRGSVMTNFSESVEFRRISAPAVAVVTTYRGMLGRTPTSAEVQLWIPILGAQPEAIESLIATIYTSPEYANRIQP